MPDVIDATGLQVATASEISTGLTSGFQAIYGSDIAVSSNAPDGQRIGIFTEASVDLRELLMSLNSSFDPDQAVGIQLDQRCSINFIKRAGGTYTVQPVSITVNTPVTLQGLDSNYNNANGTGFTVSDGNGNNFILAATTTVSPGTTSLNFRAQDIGDVSVNTNTITQAVTVVPGVTAINNPSAAESVGQNEETDVQLRVRRQKSPAILSSGYLNGLRAKLLALTGVTGAEIYENVTDTTDANGIPAHGIWAIVAGGANSDIANTIYMNGAAGCNMKGSVTFDETNSNSVVVPIKWDVPLAETLHVQFTIQQTAPSFEFDEVSIKNYIASNMSWDIGAYAETSSLTVIAAAAILAFGGGGVAVLMQISTDGVNWTDFLNASTLASQFTLAAGNITINVVA